MTIPAPKRNRFVQSALFANAPFLTAATVATPAEAKQSMYFASDIHDNVGRLAELIDHLKTVQPIDFYGLVGDCGSGNTTTTEYSDVVGVFSSERTEGAPYVLEEGNHDALNHFYTDPTGPVSASSTSDPSGSGRRRRAHHRVVHEADSVGRARGARSPSPAWRAGPGYRGLRAKHGAELSPPGTVSCCSPVPSAPTTYSLRPLTSHLLKVMKRPSGDQETCSIMPSWLNEVSWTGLLPSGLMTKTSCPKSANRASAMEAPSGDQDGNSPCPSSVRLEPAHRARD
jgi:hypothetical protein